MSVELFFFELTKHGTYFGRHMHHGVYGQQLPRAPLSQMSLLTHTHTAHGPSWQVVLGL